MAKLLHESSHLIESKQAEDGKHMVLEGVFAQAEVVNGNKRMYKRGVMENAMNDYIEKYVQANRAIGEINHPDRPFADPDLAAIRVTDLWWEGNNVHGKAIVLNTPKGQTIKGLVEGGFNLGVSTRALGSLKEQNGIKLVQDDLMFTAIDCVDMPSGPDCYVNAINESTWVQKNGVWIPVEDEVINEDKIEQIDENLFMEKFEAFVRNAVKNQNRG